MTIHPKFLNRLADIYISKARAEGNPQARAWADKFIPANATQDIVNLINAKLASEKGSK